jgi:predicted neuraminidase
MEAGCGVAAAQAGELLCSYHGVLRRAAQQDVASYHHKGVACVGLPQRLSLSKPVTESNSAT